MNFDFLIKDKHSLCVSTDTRNLKEGGVFVALKGERFNGNLFATQALEMGAAYAIVDEAIPVTCSQSSCYKGRIIKVENSLLALQELAREWRQTFDIPVLAITGTNGKTTTKELIATVLGTRYKVHYTQGNLNNQIGVPLTLLSMNHDTEIAIIEMGASHPGDIKELVDIALPTYGLITNVGIAHLQGFGSFEGVKRTKAELYDYLRNKDHYAEATRNKDFMSGFCFRNLDNPHLQEMAGDLKTIGYHTGTMPEGTHLVGSYNAENISAALCVGEYFGIDRETALQAIRRYVPSNQRSQKIVTEHNTLIVDAYNANPTSMQTAILSFLGTNNNNGTQVSALADNNSNIRSSIPTATTESCTTCNLTFILGDMLELGGYSRTAHQNIVNLLLEQKEKDVYLIGKEFAATTAPYKVFQTTDEAISYFKANPLIDRTILLKGSHGMHLEKLAPLL